jgi:hypothetical protein
MKRTTTRHITVRGVSREVAERLERLGASRGESLNATVLRILEGAVGFDARRRRLVRYATWTPDEAASFDEGLRAQRVVDEKLWR